MRNIRITSLLLIAMLTLGIAGCSEGNSINPANSDEAVRTSISVSSDETTAITRETDETVATTRETKTEEIEKTVGVETKEAEKTVETALPKSNDVWKEVPVSPEQIGAKLTLPFDWTRVLASDYVFSGTVISRKEYEVEWIDGEGNKWGPYKRSVIEVKINREYYGESPTGGDVIRIYSALPISTVLNNASLIRDNSEYVFVTKIMDDKFIDSKNAEVPDANYGVEKEFADVYIEDTAHCVMSIENDYVFMNNHHFYWNEEILKKADWQLTNDKMANPEFSKKYGYFMALKIEDFNREFPRQFETIKKSPLNSDEVYKLFETVVIQNPEIKNKLPESWLENLENIMRPEFFQ